MKDKTKKKFSKSLFTTLSVMIDSQMHVSGRVASVIMVLADKKKLPPQMRDHEEKFMSVMRRFGFKDKDSKELPYPVIALMPQNTDDWAPFVDDITSDLNSDMYAIVTEGMGTSREVFENDGKFELLHPDNLQDYALMYLGVKGDHVRVFGAPIRYNIVNRDGKLQRRIADWKEYPKKTNEWQKLKGDNDARTT